ncbi:MAG: hypothetical protein PHV34_18185 [Verrucomicrobiae bacterium]|nr:hypothetical protein [Verrucomicrobiae bacterium]
MNSITLFRQTGVFFLALLLPAGWTLAEPQKQQPEVGIEVILNDPDESATNHKTESAKTTDTAAYRIVNQPLNDFAMAMAQKARMTYVSNPAVKGVVNGRFGDTDPLAMLRAAARANGYELAEKEGRVLELVNKEVMATLPKQLYRHTFRYLRYPGTAEEQSSKIEGFFAGVLGEGAYIKFDSKTNTLVARDVDSHVAVLDELIKRLDIEKPNVLTAVTIMEVSANPRDYAGLDWQGTLGQNGYVTTVDIANSLASVLTGGAWGASAKYAVIVRPGQVRAVLRALSEKNLAEVRSQFFVSSEDNEMGQTTVARKEPIPNFQANQQTGGFDISGFTYKDIGNTLIVRPQLLPNHLVRLSIKPVLSTSNGKQTFTSSSGTGGGLRADIPIIDERSTEVVVRVPLDRSLMLGGLKQLGLTDHSNKIPLLGDIPVVRHLFSGKDVTRSTHNLVLVVEPSLLDPADPDYLDKVTERYRNSMKYNPRDKLKDIIPGKKDPVSGLVDDKS